MPEQSISLRQLKDFIRSQPDDKPVDMNTSNAGEGECGCVMIQYAREKLSAKGKLECGTQNISFHGGRRIGWLDRPIDVLIPVARWSGIESYADLKHIIHFK